MKTFKQFNEGLGRAGLGALKAIGRFGAKNPKNFAITMAGTGLVGQKVVKPVVTKLANALNPTPKTPEVEKYPMKNGVILPKQSDETLVDFLKRQKRQKEKVDRDTNKY